MRPTIRVNHLRQPSQVVILCGGGHTGDALATQRRFVDHFDRSGFIEDSVGDVLSLVDGGSKAVVATVLLAVDGASERIAVADADVFVGIDAGGCGGFNAKLRV